MVRLLLILALTLSGLAWPGTMTPPSSPGADSCAESECHHQATRVTCCGEVVEEVSCPMSGGGPCRCGVSGAPTTDPTPKAPGPRTERDQTLAVGDKPASADFSQADANPAILGACAPKWRTGLTHNEFRSLLGNWRI